MRPYEQLATLIIKSVGGKDNIKNLTHCLTRLRFVLNDDGKVDKGALANNKEIVTTQFAGGKYQVVIGTNVGDVFDEIERQVGVKGDDGGEEREKMTPINRFISIITQVMTPMLGIMGGCGLIISIRAVLVLCGVITEDSGAALVLNALGNSIFTFLPVILGYTSAKAFGMNPFTGMMLGCSLVFPGLASAISAGDPLFVLFAGTPVEMPVYSTFFGIPVMFPALGYESTVIPILLTTFFAAKVERFFNRVLPKNARYNLTPMFVLLIGGVLCILIIGPVSVMLTNILSWILDTMFKTIPVVAYGVIAFIYQPMVVLGLHWSLISIGIVERASTGSTMLLAIIVPATFAHLAVCLAVASRTKSSTVRQTALAAAAPTVFSIIEPSIYSIQLQAKKRFLICMIGGTVGAYIIGLTNSLKYASGMGITDIPTFIDPVTGDLTGMIWCIVAVAATMVVSFVLAYATYRPEDDGIEGEGTPILEAKQPVRHGKVALCAPVSGSAMPLSEMDDPVFSGGSMGKGIAFEPSSGNVVAPCDGTLSMVFPTGHAFGITGPDGIEVIVHVGIDTVQLPEGTFTKHVEQGALVKRGDLVVSFDRDALAAQGVNLQTVVVVTNSAEYLDVIELANGEVAAGDEALMALVSAPADAGKDAAAGPGLAPSAA